MRSKVNFGHPKWPTAAIMSKNSKKNKVAYRSEMARNAIESEFRTSNFHVKYRSNLIIMFWVKIKNMKKIYFFFGSCWAIFKLKKKFHIYLKWPEMVSKVNFGHQKWPMEPFCQKFQKIKSCVSIWNAQKCDQQWISDIQYGRRWPFCKQIYQKKFCIDLK